MAAPYKENTTVWGSTFGAGRDVEISKSQIKAFAEKSSRVFFIINTAPAVVVGSGSHWVALWLEFDRDTQEVTFEYFDSFGDPPGAAMKKTINHMVQRVESVLPDWTVIRVNHKRKHQKRATECGTYTLWFLQNKLAGKQFGWFEKQELGDSACARLRGKFFTL